MQHLTPPDDDEEALLRSDAELTFDQLVRLARWPLQKCTDAEMEPWDDSLNRKPFDS
jgi:hypothetical protein